MSRSWQEICAIVSSRRMNDSPFKRTMIDVRDRANGDFVVPLYDVEGEPMVNALAPQIIADAIENGALRAASAKPSITIPAVDTTNRAKRRAQTRKKALLAAYGEAGSNHWLGVRRAYRHMFGYGSMVQSIELDMEDGMANFRVRDPLTCVDPDTEILTKRGWLRYDELDSSDEVAGFDMGSKTARWTHVERINVYDYEGEMVSVDRRSLSMRLTPDHRCVVETRVGRSDNRPDGCPKFVLADDLQRTHYVPRAAEWDEYGEKSIGVDLAALLGWVAAEGHYDDDSVNLSQSLTWNPEFVAEIDAHIAALPEYEHGLSRKVLPQMLSVLRRERPGPNGRVQVSWRLPLGLSQEIRRWMPDKLLGPWALDLPTNERAALLRAFAMGDGSMNGEGWSIFQKYRHNLDVLQAVATTLGYKTSIRPTGDKWVLYVQHNSRPASLRGRRAEDRQPIPRTPYKGIVWCPTTGTGTWFARREGAVFITGNCYAEPRSPEDIRPLEDIAFVYARSVSWLMDNYPSAKNERGETVDLYQMWKAAAASRLDMFDVVEWQDEENVVIGVLSSSPRGMADPMLNNLVVNGLELRRGPNKAEMVTATMGQIVTLDKVISSVSRIMGATDMLERLTALEAIAAEKAVFPDRFVIGKDGRPPTIIGGQWKDGRTGESNLILDATQIGELVSQVGPATQQISSKLERAARLSGGNPGIFGGELTGSLRSGQTVNALAGMAVDPRIAEFQEIMAAHLVVMNQAWMATMKGYFGGKKFSMFSGNRSDGTIVEFTPSEDFETYENKVEYAFPGMDINAITVSVAQMNGAGLISKKTAMANHPLVEDDEFEVEQLQREMLKDAMMQALSTQAAQGAIPAIDIARIVQLSEEGKSIPEAVLQVQKEAQARQAASALPPGPGQGAAPEAMPGLSMPGMGAESLPPEAVAAPDQSLMNLKQLTGALMSPNTAVGANARA